jgi:hypothetical protein
VAASAGHWHPGKSWFTGGLASSEGLQFEVSERLWAGMPVIIDQGDI